MVVRVLSFEVLDPFAEGGLGAGLGVILLPLVVSAVVPLMMASRARLASAPVAAPEAAKSPTAIHFLFFLALGPWPIFTSVSTT